MAEKRDTSLRHPDESNMDLFNSLNDVWKDPDADQMAILREAMGDVSGPFYVAAYPDGSLWIARDQSGRHRIAPACTIGNADLVFMVAAMNVAARLLGETSEEAPTDT